MQQNLSAVAPVPLWKRLVLGRNWRRTLVRASWLIGFALVVLVVFKFLLLPVRVAGVSMEPTYRDCGINFINRLAYVFGKPQRGDVVAVRYSRPHGLSGPHVMLLKRIIGLPGETVAITNGVVFINGQPLDEPYVKKRDAWQLPPVKMADDEYFLIGDNRGMDQRYHEFGETGAERIVGKLLW
jgi:signal peptidase I